MSGESGTETREPSPKYREQIAEALLANDASTLVLLLIVTNKALTGSELGDFAPGANSADILHARLEKFFKGVHGATADFSPTETIYLGDGGISSIQMNYKVGHGFTIQISPNSNLDVKLKWEKI